MFLGISSNYLIPQLSEVSPLSLTGVSAAGTSTGSGAGAGGATGAGVATGFGAGFLGAAFSLELVLEQLF